MSIKGKDARAALLFTACLYLTPASADPLPCDDGIKPAFRPDAETTVEDKNARSYSEGIGIEVWLPTQAN